MYFFFIFFTFLVIENYCMQVVSLQTKPISCCWSVSSLKLIRWGPENRWSCGQSPKRNVCRKPFNGISFFRIEREIWSLWWSSNHFNGSATLMSREIQSGVPIAISPRSIEATKKKLPHRAACAITWWNWIIIWVSYRLAKVTQSSWLQFRRNIYCIDSLAGINITLQQLHSSMVQFTGRQWENHGIN